MYNVTQSPGVPSSYWWFRTSTGTLDGESYDNDTGNPGSIRWDDSSLIVALSGTLYDTDETTILSSTTICVGTPIRLVVQGGSTYVASCSGGTYSIPNVVVTGSPVLTLFLDGLSSSTRAAVVTKTVTGDVTNLDLILNRVIVRHENTDALTIADMAIYDSSDDSDVPYTAATGSASTLIVNANTELHVFPQPRLCITSRIIVHCTMNP